MSYLLDSLRAAREGGFTGPGSSRAIRNFNSVPSSSPSPSPSPPPSPSVSNFEDDILTARQEEISLLEQQLEMQRAIAEEQVAAARELQMQQQEQQAEFASILEAQVQAQQAATEAQQREQERANLIASRQRQRTQLDFASLLGSLGGRQQQQAPTLLTYLPGEI